jgi:hypothetical protein
MVLVLGFWKSEERSLKSNLLTGRPRICLPPQKGIEVQAISRIRAALIPRTVALAADHTDLEVDSTSMTVLMVEVYSMPNLATKYRQMANAGMKNNTLRILCHLRVKLSLWPVGIFSSLLMA